MRFYLVDPVQISWSCLMVYPNLRQLRELFFQASILRLGTRRILESIRPDLDLLFGVKKANLWGIRTLSRKILFSAFDIGWSTVRLSAFVETISIVSLPHPSLGIFLCLCPLYLSVQWLLSNSWTKVRFSVPKESTKNLLSTMLLWNYGSLSLHSRFILRMT